jgi:tyrosyl-tRNA synthetase
VSLPKVIADLGFAPSTSEASRQVKAGGVKIEGEKVSALRWHPPASGRFTIVVGGRKVGLIVVE